MVRSRDVVVFVTRRSKTKSRPPRAMARFVPRTILCHGANDENPLDKIVEGVYCIWVESDNQEGFDVLHQRKFQIQESLERGGGIRSPGALLPARARPRPRPFHRPGLPRRPALPAAAQMVCGGRHGRWARCQGSKIRRTKTPLTKRSRGSILRA